MAQPWKWLIPFVAACGGSGGPTIDAVMPAAAQPTALIELMGSDFCGGLSCDAAGGEVLFGLGSTPLRAQTASYDDGTIVLSVPTFADVGKTQIVLDVNGESSNAIDFEVLPAAQPQ